MRRQWFILFLGLATFAGYAREPTSARDEDWRENGRVTSHLKNVIVTSMPREIALEVATWAESVIENIEKWAMGPIPGNYAFPIVIQAEEREDEKQGFVIASQYLSDGGHIQQRITIVNRRLADPEDVLEVFCHLVLSRWVHAFQSREQLNQQVGAFPHWFSYGIAQSLYTKLISRNYEEIMQEERKGNYLPAISVVNQRVLPPGRWPEKAHAGLVMKWLSSEVSPDTLLAEAARAVADRRTLDATFMMQLLKADTPRAFNAKWDLWMARYGNRFVPGVSASDPASITRILEMRAADLGLAHPAVEVGEELPVELLIDERDMPWAQDVCRLIIWRLQAETVGKSKVIQGRVLSFLDFYALLLNQPQRIAGLTIEPDNRSIISPSSRSFKNVWDQAMDAWREMLEADANREAYISTFQSEREDATDAVADWLNEWEARQP